MNSLVINRTDIRVITKSLNGPKAGCCSCAALTGFVRDIIGYLKTGSTKTSQILYLQSVCQCELRCLRTYFNVHLMGDDILHLTLTHEFLQHILGLKYKYWWNISIFSVLVCFHLVELDHVTELLVEETVFKHEREVITSPAANNWQILQACVVNKQPTHALIKDNICCWFAAAWVHLKWVKYDRLWNSKHFSSSKTNAVGWILHPASTICLSVCHLCGKELPSFHLYRRAFMYLYLNYRWWRWIQSGTGGLQHHGGGSPRVWAACCMLTHWSRPGAEQPRHLNISYRLLRIVWITALLWWDRFGSLRSSAWQNHIYTPISHTMMIPWWSHDDTMMVLVCSGQYLPEVVQGKKTGEPATGSRAAKAQWCVSICFFW